MNICVFNLFMRTMVFLYKILILNGSGLVGKEIVNDKYNKFQIYATCQIFVRLLDGTEIEYEIEWHLTYTYNVHYTVVNTYV
jgi:hypothetical protein